MILHTHPAAFVIVGGLLGVGVALAARRNKRAQAFLRHVVPAALVIWAVIDFIVTPADRWVNGVALAVAAIGGGIAFGYERFRGSKTSTGH